MITISLNQIKAKDPCQDGWETILAARGKDADYDEQFPLSFALDSNGLYDVLWSLQCLPEHNNLWRKYAVWRSRQVEHFMTDQRSKDALEVAWRHSEGLATDAELSAAWLAAWDAYDAQATAYANPYASPYAYAAYNAAYTADRVAWAFAWASRYAARAARVSRPARDAQTKKLRQILDAGEWV